ncbi:hypothetical protein HYQ43_11935 [Paracoccus pantotrophus]|uniref:Uncharacterized protein n=1 Tax=Paracoccus pantotrophus TaxID=82367 RepID=A0A7H9BVR3_PARPN|nr:hypothetical protein [Paracoccus pantotrophus]QLH14965.1 hypothetical protein HYQ43_11935 [Paracoccus pantotrophus]
MKRHAFRPRSVSAQIVPPTRTIRQHRASAVVPSLRRAGHAVHRQIDKLRRLCPDPVAKTAEGAV